MTIVSHQYTTGMSDVRSSQDNRSKVGCVSAHHNLDNMPERLKGYWAGEGSERYSFRELAPLSGSLVPLFLSAMASPSAPLWASLHTR
jgi:hypothetical protein